MGIEIGIGTILQVAGMASQVFGTIAQGRQEKAAAQREAIAAEMEARQQALQARNAEVQGREEAQELRREHRRLQAQNVVRAGLGGLSSPTFALVEDANMAEVESDIDTVLYNATQQSHNFNIASRNSLVSAEAARSRGKSAMRGALFSAATGAAEGAFGIYKTRIPKKKPATTGEILAWGT